MRLIMILLIGALVLGGGGAGAYFYFMQEAEASAPEDGEHQETKKEDHGEKAHYEFVELDPLILPIVDNSGVSQVVSMVIAIEVADADAAKKVEMMAPKLKDAYIQDLYGMLNEHAALRGGVIQVGYIKKRLGEISHKVMGDDAVHDVLLQVVQQRPI